MKTILKYIGLAVLIFSIGGYFAKLQIQINSIKDKLDKDEYYQTRKEDSLKTVIKELELQNIQKKLKMPVSIDTVHTKQGGR